LFLGDFPWYICTCAGNWRMNFDLNIGRYVAGTSPIHRLDPRTKLGLALFLCIGILQGTSATATAWHCVLATVLFGISGLKARFVARNLRPFVYLAGMILASHLLINGAGSWQTGISVGVRLLVMVSVVSLFSWTTQPLATVAGLRRLGSPLARLKVPVDAAATSIGLAMRFAPIVVSEAQTVLRAQAARGADFRGVKRKLTLIVPLLGALFDRSFARAEVLAEAMQARGYDPSAVRTSYHRLGFRGVDVIALAYVAIWLGGAVIMERYAP